MTAQAMLAQIRAGLGGDPRLLERVGFDGPSQVLPGAFDVTGLAAVTVAAATLAIAELGARRSGGEVPEVRVDTVAASAAFRGEALLRPLGWELPPLWDPIAGNYRTADGWIRLHTNYLHHRAAALRALGLPADPVAPAQSGAAAPSREQVAALIANLRAAELEERVVAEGGCAAALYTAEQWAQHPHGRYAIEQPAVTLTHQPGSPSEPGNDPFPGSDPGSPRSGSGIDGWAGSGADGRAGSGSGGWAGSTGPLTGIRVLDLTRVLAGPVCTRTLAGWGADVLRIDPPGFAEVPALLPETTAGKHCAALDLRRDGDRARFEALLAEADVLVHGLRPGALARLGCPDPALRALNPALCIATVDAYGWAGPWAGRRGFDSLVQFSTGIATASAAATGSDRPGALPAQALDHATGYLLAAAVCRGLTGRFDGLGPADVRAALVGTANLLVRALPVPELPTELRHGLMDGEHPPRPTAELEPALARRDTDWGPMNAVAQPGTIGGASAVWRRPAGPLGRHAPVFDPTARPEG